MGLRDYVRKRRFAHTPEPKGHAKQAASPRLSFVVQEHEARALHYDFRLELDGVLKSWAVPKGPSLDPRQHHLAVQTEDHPFAYRKFEGVIPPGNYGAGNVIIWDEGWYEPRETAGDPVKILRAGLKKGHLTFVLHGQKLRGEFALIKMHGQTRGEKAWLLVKKDDEFASTKDVTKQTESVKSHQQVEAMGAPGKLPNLSKLPKNAAPKKLKPMLCTPVEQPFDKPGWLFEIKWDGYRAVGSKVGGDVALHSRAQQDFADKFRPVTEALRTFKHDVVVDGEIVVTDDNGAAHFEWLQNWHRDHYGQLHYYLFDIVWLDGHDLQGLPLHERKRILKKLMPDSDVLRYSDEVEHSGINLFKQMQQRHLEGMVAKNANSPYRPGVRGDDWLKVKTYLRQEVVIGGYTEPRGGRKYLGSLLVGVYQNGQFVYAGHSGGGIPDEQRKQLQHRLAKLERHSSPFATEPKPNAPVHWVRPSLVCEMSFTEWTKEGYMRHPQFKGMRSDKKPAEVHRELPKTVAPARRTTGGLPFEQTHLDKVFFPKLGLTKGDIFKYYESVAEYILPYIKDRPCSLLRMPSGIKGEAFFQKNNEHLPDWVPGADIFSESNNANLHWLVGGDLNTLLYMVQLGCVEINPWNSRVKHLDKPDWLVIDLDPDRVDFKKVVEVARVVKDVCDEWHLPSYPKTSGKTGLHIYIPMGAKYTYEQVKNLAHLLVLEVNRRSPKLTSVERMPEKRRHKIYLDFLQNREGQTLAAPYSLRPTPAASVSMPLHWDEVTPALKPTDFTIKNAARRLARTGDLWKPVLGSGVDVTKILEKIDESQKPAA